VRRNDLRLEGLLAIAGIIVAVYAIAQPVQRRSIMLFVPVWIVAVALLLSVGILVWRKGVEAFGYEFYPWSDFASTVTAFFLPVIAAFIAIFLWSKAKLTKRKNKKFYDFIMSCLRENRFDELVRIVEKNENQLSSVLESATLDLLFEQRFVLAMSHARTWLHLRLLTCEEMLKRLPNLVKVIDAVVRALVAEPSSPLYAIVASAYGAEERPFCTDSDWELVTKTLQNPAWYISVRADYPLLMIACELLDSGKLDDAYNRNDELYIARQGLSTRAKCPIFLALKTHVLMLEEAVKKEGDTDYYVSDLYDLFRTICEHSVYNDNVWEGPNANREFPTPFAFLMSETLSDFFFLCDHRYSHGTRPPRRIGHDLVSTWAICFIWLAESKGNVSTDSKIRRIISYMDFALQLRQAYVHETRDESRKGNCKAWSELCTNQVKEKLGPATEVREILLEAANRLDVCKNYVSENQKWLRDELGLPDRPKVSN